ncbi:MAG: hypothetical protein JRI23_17200, partial [Deltaproteobacteria bacterium]|nr:hypothetical protein [Deltaproteobacteria bacterium]MBW2533556.1 hypothetical protein [Deltaproteobacteria bacterium]
RLQDVFESTIAYHLGLASAADVAQAAAPQPVAPPDVETVDPVAAANAWSAVTRPRAFVAVCGMGLVAALGAVLAVQRYGIADVVLLPVDEGQVGAAAPVRDLFDGVLVRGSPKRPSCRCQRPVSPLWQGGVDMLGIVVAPSKGSFDRLWLRPGETVSIAHPGRRADSKLAPEVELELGVVNNGAAELDTVSLVLTFAQRSPQGRRVRIRERGLHWPAKLGPGESVRWTIEAEGTEVRVDCRLTDKLGTVPPADGDAFHELLEARLVPVRIHAAMMLAYLGDSRARAALGALGPLNAVEQQARAEIERALTPLRPCDQALEGGVMRLCLHNGTDRLLRRLVVAAEDAEPARSRRWVVEDLFHPGRGLVVALPWPSKAPPTAVRLEALSAAAAQVEGAELLPSP